jgi:hypothetical protein
MNNSSATPWRDRFEELLAAPAGAQVIATQVLADGSTEVLQRFPIARHYEFYPNDGVGDPVVSYLQIGWGDGPAYADLGDEYFDQSRPRSATAARVELDGADVVFWVPTGPEEDRWVSTIEVRVTACTEDNSWVVDEWDVYSAALPAEEFDRRYRDRITLDV